MNLVELTGIQLRDRILKREVSAREATAQLFARIEACEPRIRAYLTLDKDAAVAQAAAVDAKLGRGVQCGKLAGIPVAVKDNMCTAGLRTTCASKILGHFIPPYDAHVVERLKAEDAIIIGKTNLDEFAMGSSTENSGFQVTRNPWDVERIPGGSSGGSAAAMAADMASMSLGSDTGGSIRQPAALCGVVGLKPTYGRVSRYGLVAFASSLDQIGPITKDVADAALLLAAIAGHDARDSTCADVPVPDYAARLDDFPAKLRIGVAREYFGEGLNPEIRKSIEDALGVYRRLGAEVVDVSLPHTDYAVATYYIVANAEASSNLARYDGVHYGYRTARKSDILELFSRSRAEGFGDEVKRRIMLGTYALSSGYYDAYYMKAAKVRQLFKRDFDAAFERVDCIICPTSPTPAFKVGERTANPLEMYLSDIYTISANLAGLPGVSVPCGFTAGGLPIGMQILGKPFDELKVLQVARAFERQGTCPRLKPRLTS